MKLVIEGLDELRARFKDYPHVYKREVGESLKTSLLIIWEKVPSYPRAKPESTYQRTGTLGRSLGTDMRGQRQGEPDIYETRMGPKVSEASFGTRLYYAPDVIGEGTQAEVHRVRWWTLDGKVLKLARSKIEKEFQNMAGALVRWLDKGVRL